MRLYDPLLLTLALMGVLFLPLKFWPFVLIGGAFGGVLVYVIRNAKPKVHAPAEFKP